MSETTNSPTKPNEPACTECSRLASRVEELENLIAKQSGCSRCNDSASGSTSANDSTEIRSEMCIHDVPLLDECGWCKQAMAGSAETGGEKAAPQILVKFLASMDYTLPDDAKEVAAQLRTIAWQPIDSAPKTGEHILVAVFDGGIGFGTCGGKKQAWAGVVHYWEHDEPGWYMSTANGDIRVEPTHWQEISELDGPNFPRTSQNKTVSSGVEGAHEGTTADKSELLPTQLPKEK
jgi:hypothetical protein